MMPDSIGMNTPSGIGIDCHTCLVMLDVIPTRHRVGWQECKNRLGPDNLQWLLTEPTLGEYFGREFSNRMRYCSDMMFRYTIVWLLRVLIVLKVQLMLMSFRGVGVDGVDLIKQVSVIFGELSTEVELREHDFACCSGHTAVTVQSFIALIELSLKLVVLTLSDLSTPTCIFSHPPLADRSYTHKRNRVARKSAARARGGIKSTHPCGPIYLPFCLLHMFFCIVLVNRNAYA